MYWLYLIIFISTVFVPEYVIHGRFGLPVEATQELMLLLLGLLGFAIFLWLEKRNFFHREQWLRVQKHSNQFQKDLTTSYSYIGETNRKLDILKNLALEIPVENPITEQKEREIYAAILDAIAILAKSNKIILRFRKEPFGVVKEIKTNDKLAIPSDALREKERAKKATYLENEAYSLFVSPKYQDGTRASAVIIKEAAHKNIDDPDIIKVLLSYALFAYIFRRRARIINKYN